MADINTDQLLRLFETLGELREGMAALHRAVEAATTSSMERINQQSSRLDRQVEKLDDVVERVSGNEKKIDSHDNSIKSIADKIKIVDELETWKAGQTGIWRLIREIIPWVLTAGTIAVVIYQTHYEPPQDNTDQPAIVTSRHI